MSDRSNKRNEKRNNSGRKRVIVEQFANFYGIILRIFEESHETYLYKNSVCDSILKKKKERETGLTKINEYPEFRPYSLIAVSSKDSCFDAIAQLYKSKLLERVKDNEHIKEQKKNTDRRKHYFKLSENGKNISKLLREVDDYQINYFNLKQSMEVKLPRRSAREIREMKRYTSGWKHNDIEFYYTFRSNVLDLIDLIDRNFMQIVLLRYSKILDDLFFLNNINAKKILNDIVIKIFEMRMRFILDNYKIYEESADARWIENYRNPIYQKPQFEEKYETGLQGTLPLYKDIENFFNFKIVPPIIYEEVRKIVLSYLNLIEFSKDRTPMDDMRNFFSNKSHLIRDYILQNKEKDTAFTRFNHNYENLVKIRFDTQELFFKILQDYKTDV